MAARQPHQAVMTDIPQSNCFSQKTLSLAMAYVIMQPEVKSVYNPEDALKQGTLFPELDKPFLAYRGER